MRRRTTGRGCRAAAALLALVVVGTVALAGCSNGSVGSSGDQGFVGGSGQIRVLDAGDRKPVGTVAGPTLSGGHASLGSLRGKVVVVNVWGSWCPPCRAEAPVLAKAAGDLRSKGVVFLGINSRDYEKAGPLAFQRRYHVPYPSIYDPGGRTLLGFHGTLTPNSIPSTVIVDRRGRVAAGVFGRVTRATLDDLVDEVAGA